MRRSALAVLSCLVLPAALHAQAERWWADVKALSDDSMRGRETGSPEHHKAALYIAATFRLAGLQPAGTNGYLQAVPFVVRSLDDAQSSLALVRDGTAQPLVLGEDAALQPRAPLAASLDAPVVFAGYALHLPEYKHDDLAGLDVTGKVVAYLTGIPAGIPGPVLSHARNQVWATLRAAGAVGVITFSTGRGGDTAFIRAQQRSRAGAFALADAGIDGQTGNKLSIQVNAARAERLLFAGAPERFAALQLLADSGRPLPHFALPVSVRSTARLIERPVMSENVVGILRGSDPKLRDEYVVLTAHLDHLGVGRPVNGDSVFNGAMDNGSGSALLMDVARQMAAQRITPKRSIIFLAVTGEEKGLLGSRYYANHPTVPPDQIVADLNTDMFLPIIPFKMVMVNGLEESNLADDARRAGQTAGVPVITDPEPEENRFVRSDQYSFILRGVPALSMKVGFQLNTPEHRAVLDFRENRYHHVGDDVQQHVDLVTAAAFERYYLALVQAVANRDARPTWNATSYFKRFAAPASGTQ